MIEVNKSREPMMVALNAYDKFIVMNGWETSVWWLSLIFILFLNCKLSKVLYRRKRGLNA